MRRRFVTIPVVLVVSGTRLNQASQQEAFSAIGGNWGQLCCCRSGPCTEVELGDRTSQLEHDKDKWCCSESSTPCWLNLKFRKPLSALKSEKNMEGFAKDNSEATCRPKDKASSETTLTGTNKTFRALRYLCEQHDDVNSQCQNLVKKTLANSNCSAAENVDDCIGAVMANNKDHSEKCCKRGTDFDDFLLAQVPDVKKEELDLSSETAILVIDMQKDFTEGSFGQPCWNSGGEGLNNGISELIRTAAEKGATIIASKDLHPSSHCSFKSEGACKNTKDYLNMEFTADKRYVNEFPSHCSFEKEDDKEFVVPQAAPETPFCKALSQFVFKGPAPPGHFCADEHFIGAAFDDDIAAALAAVPQSQVEVVFKGFDPEYDSFSAIPHLANFYDPYAEEEVAADEETDEEDAADLDGYDDDQVEEIGAGVKRESGDDVVAKETDDKPQEKTADASAAAAAVPPVMEGPFALLQADEEPIDDKPVSADEGTTADTEPQEAKADVTEASDVTDKADDVATDSIEPAVEEEWPQEEWHEPSMESLRTGGFALPAERAKACHGKWNEEQCYPTKDEVDDPLNGGLRSIMTILNERKIKKIIVVGLVYDFCVKETAVFASEAARMVIGGLEGWDAAGEAAVAVLADLTRPSFDGKPGFPYTEELCQDGRSEGAYCTSGAGTVQTFGKVRDDLAANAVGVIRYYNSHWC